MKLLVVGGDNVTGTALVRQLTEQAVEHRVLPLQVGKSPPKSEIVRAISLFSPSQVINVACHSNPESVEADAEAARACEEHNSQIPTILAEVCGRLGIPLIQHSSSLVFDGLKLHPYTEEDAANPVGRYGRSKWYGERAIRSELAHHIILRTDWVFGLSQADYFVRLLEVCKAQQGRLSVMSNRFSPTPASDVARVILAIARQLDCGAEVWGTYHYCAQQPLSQEVFIEQVLQEAGRFDREVSRLLSMLNIEKLPVTSPYIANSVLNGQKLFETFGIKARARGPEITALLSRLCCA